jgi:hypothetical protein
MYKNSIQKTPKETVELCGIAKRVIVHSLSHPFAEKGYYDILEISGYTRIFSVISD